MPATHTLNISDHKDDPMISAWYSVHASGQETDLERANAALVRADLYRSTIETHGDDLDKAQAEAVCERVALAASACAKAQSIGELRLAHEFANAAQSETLILSTFDYVNVG